MFCKTFSCFLFALTLAPTRAFRRKSDARDLARSVGTTSPSDTYLPICAKDIVKETCDTIIGGLKKGGDSTQTIGWLPLESIQELMAANEKSMISLLKLLGYPSKKLPTKDELGSLSEDAKKVLRNYGMQIANNAHGEKVLSVACESVCDAVKQYVAEKYILPPSSDIMAMTTSAGTLDWRIDVRPESLDALWKPGDMPNLEEGDSHGLYGATSDGSGNSGNAGNATALRQPEGPSQLEYTKWAIVEGLAQLFRFYPVREVVSAGSLLQTSVSSEVVEPSEVPEWKPDEAVEVGKKGIAYVRKVIRQIELPGTQEIIKDWFGLNDGATKAEILRVMNSVITVMGNVHYHYKGPTCKEKTFAYVYPNGEEKCSFLGNVDSPKACKTNAEGKYIYYLCDLYLKTDDGEKIETLVHEGSHHFSAYTDDVCSDHYHDVKLDICDRTAYGRDSCAKLAKIDHSRALKNADNHCYFVQAVSDPSYARGQRCPKGSRTLSWFADKDGDCQCPSDSTCEEGGVAWCPSSIGRHSQYFSASCSNCKCKTPAPKSTCPAFALSTTPDSDGDCECPKLTQCKDDGYMCPSFSRGRSEHYFRSTCTTCKCEDKPQILLLASGNIVKVKTEFETSSKHKRKATVGKLGRVSQIDGDGDAYIDFEAPIEGSWVVKNNFANLKKIELKVGNTVKVIEEFTSISKSGTKLTVGLIGAISTIDEYSDALIDWEGIGTKWVSWKSFNKIEKVKSQSSEGQCGGAIGPDNHGDCRCPAKTQCRRKTGEACLTTDNTASHSLFAVSCTDCQCHGSDKTPGNSTVPGDPADKLSESESESEPEAEPGTGAPFARRSIYAMLVSTFVSLLVQ